MPTPKQRSHPLSARGLGNVGSPWFTIFVTAAASLVLIKLFLVLERNWCGHAHGSDRCAHVVHWAAASAFCTGNKYLLWPPKPQGEQRGLLVLHLPLRVQQ
jgi:hypothetical protein